MKKIMSYIVVLALICTLWTTAFAGSWVVPGPGGSGASDGNYYPSGISVRLIDDLSTRSGPSTTYTECGTYRMKGQKVTVISRAFDNGGVQWAQVEIIYGAELTYNGTEQTGVEDDTEEPARYTLEGNTGTNAGSYEATATLADGYVWVDSDDEIIDSDELMVAWSIAPLSITD